MINPWMIFLSLVFAHFIADWGLQTQFMSDTKSKRWFVMFAHCMVYTGAIFFTLQWLGAYALWKIIFIFVGHYACDYIKGRFAKSEKDWWMLYPDHIWHGIQLAIISFI